MFDIESDSINTGQEAGSVLAQREQSYQDVIPEGYTLVHSFSVITKRPLIWMNLIGIALFLLMLALIFWGLWFYDQIGEPLVLFIAPQNLPLWIYFIIAAGTFVLHELLHGLPIWLFGKKPRFGIKITKLVLYTTCDASFTRHQYIVVLLTPLTVISLVGGTLMLLVSLNIALWLAIMVAMNFASSIGDMWMAAISTSYPPEAVFLDVEDGSRVFLPEEMANGVA